MKKIIYFLLVAPVLLSCGGEAGESDESATTVEVKSYGDLKIGYYNTDSIALNFDYYITELSELEKQQAVLEKEGAALQSKYQNKALEYQRGMQANTLSPNQIKNYEAQLGKMQNDLAQFEQVKLAEFQNRQMASNQILMNKVGDYSRAFAKANKLTLFFALSKPSGLAGSIPALAYADTTLDMTMPFINYMNKEEKSINKSAAE